MYYSSGNYEAFAHPKKPEGVDHKSAYIIGTGLAALSAACYLVRDGQMKGERIHIFEKDPIPGGACDGFEYPGVGYVMRGGREMDNHFEVMWDLFRSIPSIETEGVSVLDEYYWLNKEDPNYSLCRATVNRGQDAHTDGKFAVSDKAQMEIMKLFFTPDEELYDKRIDEYFDDAVFDSNFWLYWRTMFAFENWHSALEMKRYIKRYIHHIGGLPDFTALRKEICMEWLYHIGVPESEIEELAENSANTIPVMMPYIDAFFMPRNDTDRPKVVPDGAVNFAFIGQFAETARDTIFTTEYSMRTGMEAVYTLLNVDRGVPEVWGSTYDVRDLLNAAVKLRDGASLTQMKLGFKEKIAVRKALDFIRNTDVEKLLKEYHVI